MLSFQENEHKALPQYERLETSAFHSVSQNSIFFRWTLLCTFECAVTQGHEHQATGIIGTLQSLLPQPSVPKLNEMLPGDREGEGGFPSGSGATSCN